MKVAFACINHHCITTYKASLCSLLIKPVCRLLKPEGRRTDKSGQREHSPCICSRPQLSNRCKCGVFRVRVRAYSRAVELNI